VIVTNGGAEAIHLVARALGGHPRSEPEFGLHPRTAHGPIWRSNPHSPSGALATMGESADVWDEAFYPLAAGEWTAARSGLVVGSLTKTFTCPGLRLGYVLLDETTDPDEMRRHQPHWSVNALALACLPHLLDSADLTGWASQIATARDELVELLASHHLTVQAKQAPWVLASAQGRPGVDLRTELAAYGVLVRDCTSFGMRGTYRIAVPDRAGLRQLSRGLERAGVDGNATRH
ncbi:MAG: aminotransferase class I/II-fold pyridoxal phosphate-dependent enzyme, partial [Ornithinimicrobium sp.]